MNGRTIAAILAPTLLTLTLSCAAASLSGQQQKKPREAPTSFFNEGKDLVLGVDARASRVAGPAEFLPVQVVVLNRTNRVMDLDRESFTLVRPDGVNLPAASPEEFWRDYHRARADLHLGEPFLENVFGHYPEHPFRWFGLDLFPERISATVPREGVSLRFSQGTFGYLYFRNPEGEGPIPTGVYKLLLRSRGSDATYVLDFVPYGEKKKENAR